MRFFLSAFCLGILSVTWASSLAHIVLWLLWLLGLQVLTAIFVGVSRSAFIGAHKSSIAYLLAVSAAFCGGALFHAQTADNQLSRQLPPSLEGIPLLIEGRVLNMPTIAGAAYRFQFDVSAACRLSDASKTKRPSETPAYAGCSTQTPFSGKVLLSYYLPRGLVEKGLVSKHEATPLEYPANLKPGTLLQLVVKLNRPHGLSNPGGFDYEAFLFRNKILAKGYVRGELTAALESEVDKTLPSPSVLIERLRFDIRNRLLESSANARNTGIVLALGLGESSLVSQSLWNQLRATGTTHLLVVSGLHVGMIAMFLVMVSRGLWRICLVCLPTAASRAPHCIKFCLWFSLLGTAGFALFTGWSLPTQRAVAMLTVFAVSRLSSRRFGVITGLLFALTFVLVLSPLVATGSGFWLSFVAVSVLVLFAAPPQRAPLEESGNDTQLLSRFSARARQFAFPQIVVTLGLILPLLVFGVRISLLAPIINLLAIPFLTLALLPASLLAVLDVALLGQSALGAIVIADFLCDQLVRLLAVGAELNLLWEPQVTPSIASYLLAFVCLCACLVPIGWRARCVCGMWTVMLGLNNLDWRSEAQAGECNQAQPSLRLDQLDVGQGLALIIRTNCHALLYDTGASLSAEFEMGSAVIRPALRVLGIKRLDRLVISHADNDHAGGAAGVLRSVAVTDIHVGGYAENFSTFQGHLGARAMDARPCRRGDSWRWDGVVFSYLNPVSQAVGESLGGMRGSQNSRNSQSCVLKTTLGEAAVLLTGDIERAEEASLALRYQEQLRATVMVAPHHGSKTSSSYALLKRVDPEIVIVAAGYKNSFGHPHPEVLRRYEILETPVFNTAVTGMLSVRLDERGVVSQSRAYRLTNRRYWRPIP